MSRAMVVTLLATASCIPSPSTVPPPAARAVQVVEHVTVIDGRGGAPIADAVVVVEGGRIRAVGRRGTVRIPARASRLDGEGGFLLPGFVDAHAHVALGPVRMEVVNGTPQLRVEEDLPGSGRSLRLLLAAGITTIRDPGGPAHRTVALRDSVAAGLLLGPRMRVAGEVIDRSSFAGLTRTVSSVDDVRAEVRRQAAAGVDMIKLYSTLTPEMTAAGVDEAHRLGIRAVTHPMLTTWTEAARAGIDGIVHVLGWSPRMLPEGQRAAFKASLAGTQFMYRWLELADLEAPEIDSAIAAMAERRVILDPTLVVFERALWGDDPRVTQSPELAAASPALLENWRTAFRFDRGWSAEDYRRAKAAWPKALQLTRMLFERGVPLAAGTDANNPWVVPGESFHRELELLVSAGIPPADVLVIATRNGALAAGLLAETGTIEVGKRADLVLLRRDPIADISATRSVRWVMKDGMLYRPEQLRP